MFYITTNAGMFVSEHGTFEEACAVAKGCSKVDTFWRFRVYPSNARYWDAEYQGGDLRFLSAAVRQPREVFA